MCYAQGMTCSPRSFRCKTHQCTQVQCISFHLKAAKPLVIHLPMYTSGLWLILHVLNMLYFQLLRHDPKDQKANSQFSKTTMDDERTKPLFTQFLWSQGANLQKVTKAKDLVVFHSYLQKLTSQLKGYLTEFFIVNLIKLVL